MTARGDRRARTRHQWPVRPLRPDPLAWPGGGPRRDDSLGLVQRLSHRRTACRLARQLVRRV
eukprot:16450354-Heterocapsa_arctica.AAC.1